MEIFTTVLAYGYIFIVGFVFLVMLIQLLSFYVAGKITGSINDEFMSAFTLFGSLFFLGVASTLVNAVISIFLPSPLIPAIAAFVIYLAAMIYAVVRIYDLSAGKAFLHLLLSFVMTLVVTGLLVYGAINFLPKNNADETGSGTDTNSDTNVLGDTEEPATTDGTVNTEDVMVPDVTDGASESDSAAVGGPKLPGAAVGSHTSCSAMLDCENPGELCFAGSCQVPAEIKNQFTVSDDCSSLACENCESGTLVPSAFGTDTAEVSICAECTEGSELFACKTGFSCRDYKCVADQQ